jgi:hypothetical protein
MNQHRWLNGNDELEMLFYLQELWNFRARRARAARTILNSHDIAPTNGEPAEL